MADTVQSQLSTQCAVFFSQPVVAIGFFRLTLQLFQTLFYFKQQIIHPVQISICFFEFLECLTLTYFIFRNPCGFFEQCFDGIIPILQDIIHHIQFDDRI